MKRLTVGIVLLFTTVFAFSLDFGGNLEDSTYYHYSGNTSWYHADTLSLWLKTSVGKGSDFFMQGSYTYTTDSPYAFNIDYFKIENKSPTFFNYAFGRFYTSDFSGYIYSGKLDGVSASLNYPWGVVSVRSGYTGLQFNTAALQMTIADQNDKSGVFDLESPRVVNGVEVVLPDLFLKQSVRAGIWMQFDMRPDSQVTAAGTSTPSSTGGKLDSQYFGGSVSGSLLSNLYYDSFAWFGTGRTLSYIDGTYKYKLIYSFLGSAGVRYYLPDMLASKVDLRFLVSSGDSDYTTSFLEGNTKGNGTNFTPITDKTAALVFNPVTGNLLFTRLGYSLKPFVKMKSEIMRNIQVELKNITFFRSTTGQISESGLDTNSKSLYLGTEVDGAVNFRPYSDLGLSLSGGVFIPNNGTGGAFLKSQRKMEVLARLGLSFSF